MPLISGLRILNGLTVGNVNATCLESLLQNDSKKADFAGIIESPGYACLLSGSNTATFALTRSNTAMNELFTDTVAGCVALSTPEFANNFAYSGCAFNYAMTNDFALCRFANSAPAIRCSMAQGTTFVCCLTSSNTNIARFIACPFFQCSVLRCQPSMCAMMANQNVAAYFYADPVAKNCLSGNATAVCNAFNTLPWVDYSLTPGVTQSFLRCDCLGNQAFSQPLSSFCYIRNACALNVLFNTPACALKDTSCLFTCFAFSCYGLQCAFQEYCSGNTTFISCLCATNVCKQFVFVANNVSFMREIYRRCGSGINSGSNLWNCMWLGTGCSSTQYFALKNCICYTCAVVGYYDRDRSPSCAIRVSLLCDSGNFDSAEITLYNCYLLSRDCAITSSNNGNFLLFGPGTAGRHFNLSSCSNESQKALYGHCALGQIYRANSAVQTSGFLVDRGLLWSNDQGISWCKLCFCLPNTFFQCAYFTGVWSASCCNPSCDTIGLNLTSAWTCANTFWIGWTAGPEWCGSPTTTRWMHISGHVYGCIGANNVPVIKSIQNCSPIPLALTNWCCGFFSGIGLDKCVVVQGVMCHALNACCYAICHKMHHIVGRLCCECGAPQAFAADQGSGGCNLCNNFSYFTGSACCPPAFVINKIIGGYVGNAYGAPSMIMVSCSCCPTDRIKSIAVGLGHSYSGDDYSSTSSPCTFTAGAHLIVEYCSSAAISCVFASISANTNLIPVLGGMWAVANVVYFIPHSAVYTGTSDCTTGCYAGKHIFAARLGNCPACNICGGISNTDFACYQISNIQCASFLSDQMLAGSRQSRETGYSIFVNQERCTFLVLKMQPQASAINNLCGAGSGCTITCAGNLWMIASPPCSPYYANNAPLCCHFFDCNFTIRATSRSGGPGLSCAFDENATCFLKHGTFSTICESAWFIYPNCCGRAVWFPKGYAVLGSYSCCCGYLHGNNVTPTYTTPNVSSWCGIPAYTSSPTGDGYIALTCGAAASYTPFASFCMGWTGCGVAFNGCHPQLVETSKGYPAFAMGMPICLCGFFANAEPFTTCTLAMKFVDVFI